MKREVWVECEGDEPNANQFPALIGEGKFFKKITLHESRWIPVSEKPEREGRYPVVFDSEKEFSGSSSYWDGNNWCGYVSLWLEAPPLPTPLPVETEPSDFEKWYAHHGDWYEKKLLAEKAWNAAKETTECAPPPWRTSKDGIHCDYCGYFTDSHSDECKARATSSPATE